MKTNAKPLGIRGLRTSGTGSNLKSQYNPRGLGLTLALFCIALSSVGSSAFAQSVCLPAPRLLTTIPMGGMVGSEFELKITGEHIDDADQLVFSDPKITATRKLDAAGQPESGKYVVKIAADCPVGIYETRLMTRLGLSSSRAFSVGLLPEVTQTKPNRTLATAMELKVNSLCNSVMTPRAVDFYSFEAHKGQRIVVDCASKGIDSKLEAVLVIGDAAGRDLLVERSSGLLDYTIPADGRYVIKVHELTYKGGHDHFYRMALHELPAGASVVRQHSTHIVNSFSWPPIGLKDQAETAEAEPNNTFAAAQKISLPCDISGSFFPAADVDVFEFTAKKGEVWWVEVASQRLGLPTDPSILVQQVAVVDGQEKLTDVAELSDIPSPVKLSSNGYAYDGPAYDAGSSDILGKLTIQQDGVHRLQLRDLFGGTRNDPRNIYRLVIRQAAPDFAVVAWGLHMELRNGDRAALSKPVALRGGSTIALEVVTVRRDGFDGPIELLMDGLPEGVTAQGLTIPAGKSRGILLVTAHQDAPRAVVGANFFGRAQINGTEVTRPGRLASFAWPIPDAWNEIPSPRLMADVPVSVSGFEFAPITIAPAVREVHEIVAGGKLKIPLKQNRRSEFSGATMQLKTFGAGFENAVPFDVSLTADATEAVLDTAATKTAPGDYVIGFYGGAVAKYRHHPEAVVAADEAHKKAVQELMALEAESKKLTEEAQAAATDVKAEKDQAAAAAAAKVKAAQVAVNTAAERLKQATATAAPRDIVDIVVSEPISVRVKPAETK